MNSLPTRAILGAGTAVVAALAVTASGLPSAALGFACAVLAMAFAVVAVATQLERLRQERHLVYRPVYARRQIARRRVRSDD